MNNSRTKLSNYAFHSFQFFVLEQDKILRRAWQKFLRFLAFMKVAIDLPNRKTGRGWILKEEAERMNANNAYLEGILRSCACTTNTEDDGAPNRWKKRGSKSWEACQKFDFLRGLKYLEDIVSVFAVEILHLKYAVFFSFLMFDDRYLICAYLSWNLEIKNR